MELREIDHISGNTAESTLRPEAGGGAAGPCVLLEALGPGTVSGVSEKAFLGGGESGCQAPWGNGSASTCANMGVALPPTLPAQGGQRGSPQGWGAPSISSRVGCSEAPQQRASRPGFAAPPGVGPPRGDSVALGLLHRTFDKPGIASTSPAVQPGGPWCGWACLSVQSPLFPLGSAPLPAQASHGGFQRAPKLQGLLGDLPACPGGGWATQEPQTQAEPGVQDGVAASQPWDPGPLAPGL